MGELRPHQVAPANRLLDLLRSGDNAIDLSDTGVGKTYVAAYVAKQLGLPTLAVVPKISKTMWRKVATDFGDDFSIVGYEELRMGRSGYGQWENNPPRGFINERYYKCQCCQLIVDFDDYQPCYTHPVGVHCIEEKKKPWKYGAFKFYDGVRFLIFDEIHRCNGIKSRNADMLIAARRQRCKTLGLSATAACGPLQMKALGYLLDLHNLTNFYGWSRKYGCGKIEGIPGWHWLAGKDRQKEFMAQLNGEIIPTHGVRVRVNDIPGFPKRTVEACEYDLDAGGQIDALYREMCKATDKLKERAARDVASDHPLTKNLRQKQMIELLKVPLAIELAQEYLEKGCSIGIFVNFAQTMGELRRRLNCNCFIDGSAAGQKFRSQNIDNFCDDRERLIILNNEAGGISVSLPDSRGVYPRVGLVMPPLSARTFKQLIGRFHREGAKSPCHYKVLLAANTRETSIYKKLQNKLDNLDALNDGDFEVE